jgi:6-hydroxynicotinate 3-monooxygenase
MVIANKPTIAVIGCGLGGAAITALLQRYGYKVRNFEQTSHFAKSGAGIHLAPNLIKALRGLDIEKEIQEKGNRPLAYTSRDGNTGECLFTLPLKETAENVYGSRYFTIHRGDFHQILISAIKPGTIEYGKRLIKINAEDDYVELMFSDGTKEKTEIVIGADGLSSKVREILYGESSPHFANQIAYRSIVPASKMPDSLMDDYSKWWGKDRFIVAYFLSHTKEYFYFVAGIPASVWPTESSSLPGDHDELIASFSEFHPTILNVLHASDGARKWPLFERPPHAVWHRGRIVMLGDACHPMRPHMAQGAAMAIEDGVMLVRSLEAAGPNNWDYAFRLYEKSRIERTTEIQNISSQAEWFRQKTDPGWVFKYNVWDEPIIHASNS